TEGVQVQLLVTNHLEVSTCQEQTQKQAAQTTYTISSKEKQHQKHYKTKADANPQRLASFYLISITLNCSKGPTAKVMTNSPSIPSAKSPKSSTSKYGKN